MGTSPLTLAERMQRAQDKINQYYRKKTGGKPVAMTNTNKLFADHANMASHPLYNDGRTYPTAISISDWHGIAINTVPPLFRLKLRLNRDELPFEVSFMTLKDKAHVLLTIVKDGQYFTIEANLNDFPNDELVARLRLLL